MTVNERPVGGTAPSLERDAIGLPEVLFQSITHMAPAVATALSIGAATTFAGGITPLAVLFAMIASCSPRTRWPAREAPAVRGRHVHLRRRGLGSFFGWLMAWGFALAEPLVMPLLLGGFGFFGAIFLSTYLGINFEYAVDRARRAVRPGGLVPDLPRHRDLDPHRRRAGHHRDRDLPARLVAAHRERRSRTR